MNRGVKTKRDQPVDTGREDQATTWRCDLQTHCLTGDSFTAFARFSRTIDFHLAFGNRDFRLRAAFAPSLPVSIVAAQRGYT